MSDQTDKKRAKAADISISKILQSPPQIVFAIGCLATLGMLVPFTMAGARFSQKSNIDKPEGYVWPHWTDFKLTAIWAVIFGCIELLAHTYFGQFFRGVCKEQKDMKMRELRSQKIGLCCYRALYFISVTAWGYYVLKDQYYLPPSLGGSGDFDSGMKEYPYANHAPQLKEYLLIPMSYHLGGVVVHFVTTRRNDFIEMGLHHIVTLYLFSGCYMCNVWEIGSVIAFLHDIADITTNIVKAFAETNYGNTTAVIFVTHMSIWFYTRNFLLPYMIYKIYVMPDISFKGEALIQPFFCYLLSLMFMLHCFWFYMFISMISKFVKSGSTEDEQSKTIKDEKKE